MLVGDGSLHELFTVAFCLAKDGKTNPGDIRHPWSPLPFLASLHAAPLPLGFLECEGVRLGRHYRNTPETGAFVRSSHNISGMMKTN